MTLGPLGKCVELRPRHCGLTSKPKCLDDRCSEGTNLRALEQGGEVNEFFAHPQIGLVGPETVHRLAPRDHRYLARTNAGGELCCIKHRSGDESEHVLLPHERSLDIELSELKLAISA